MLIYGTHIFSILKDFTGWKQLSEILQNISKSLLCEKKFIDKTYIHLVIGYYTDLYFFNKMDQYCLALLFVKYAHAHLYTCTNLHTHILRPTFT